MRITDNVRDQSATAGAERPLFVVQQPRRTRLARDSELRRTAQLHADCLPGGFFVRLGLRFLMRYHRTFHRSPTGVLLVVGRPGSPTGFLAGTLDNEVHYRWVARHESARLALAGAAALAARPVLLAGFARTRAARYLRWVVRRLRKERTVAPPTDGPVDAPRSRIAVLTHVAVDERVRGRGHVEVHANGR